MNKVSVSIVGGKEFVSHQPLRLTYFIAFKAVADFMLYDVGLYDDMNLLPEDEVVFDITTELGDPVKFTGVLYSMETLGQAGRYRLHFVSKYFRSLMSTEALYGGGLVSDVIGSFYAKAGVAKITKDDSDVSVDSIIFPQGTRTDGAILFLLNRATAANDSYLVGTVVGESAYVRDIKKGNEVRGFSYTPIKVVDNRKKIDIMGGIRMSVASDAEELGLQEATSKGDNKTKVDKFYGITNAALAAAYVKARQRHIYYQGYIAHIASMGWVPLLGSRIIVDKDTIDDKRWYRSIIRGQYFVNSQMLSIDFSRSLSKSTIGMQLVA